ncbi:MAG: 30S ribosomal protein S16 [Salinibacterium sp.]|nr:MAG: 30S ribosomal protein S16 [Salinibacterium sp.]
MAVKIRLKRLGKIRAPYYRIVVADSRSKRDGRAIEEIGKYHPTEEPSFIEVDSERAQYWLSVGAQPSPQVEAILKLTGDWGIFKGDKNAKSTVKTKEPKAVFQADEKKKPVLKPKSEKPVKASAPADEDAAAATGDDLAADLTAVVSDGAPEEAPVADAVDAVVGDEPAAVEPAASEESAPAEEPAADADKA